MIRAGVVSLLGTVFLRNVLLGAVLLGAAPLGAALSSPSDDKVLVLRPAVDATRLEAWRAATDGRPSLRGFRAPILAHATGPLELNVAAGVAESEARAARTIAEQLARNGARATLVAAMADLGPAPTVERLERAGFPVDLLDCWAPPGAESLPERVARELAAGRDRAELLADLQKLPFAYASTIPAWALATECGDHDAAAIRLQVSSATDYAKPGEGGAMDVFRDLARLLPDAGIVVGVESKHLAGVEREARVLAADRRAPITLVESPLPLAQWAQDSAKPGLVERAGGVETVWLAPRFASRGEDGSTFIAAENLALEGFAATGRSVVQSRLVFQGGNLLAVRDPLTGKRSLLVGEAEVARNRALGLSRDEVLAAFR